MQWRIASRPVRWGALLLALPVGAWACASVLGGIDDGVLLDGADGGDATADAPLDVEVADASCQAVGPDSAAGLFVAAGGLDTGGCGGETNPCATIQKALDLARDSANSETPKKIVYVAHGEYNESITLFPGVEVQGGWEFSFNRWQGNCTSRAHEGVIIRGADAVTVTARDVTPATLTTLTIVSRQANAGESLYGIFASGTTSLALHDVLVQAGDGGAGVAGATGDAGTTGGSNCSAGTGEAGVSSTSAGVSADSGSFTEAGYMTTTGGPGGPGSPGDNGKPAPAPSCLACVTCNALCVAQPNGQTSCGAQGAPGCGGAPGQGGAGGGSGGSSVGLYVWDATVDVVAASIAAGNGGPGGPGGPGGAGGPGGTGTVGTPGSSCVAVCTPAGINCVPSSDAGPGSTGGTGGAGGNGGVGGGGAGGSSYAIYIGGAGRVNLSGTKLSHGEAGAGGGTAPSGQAGDLFPPDGG